MRIPILNSGRQVALLLAESTPILISKIIMADVLETDV